MAILAGLPLLCSLCLYLGLSGWWLKNHSPELDWYRPLLWSATIIGSYLVATSEILSLLHRLNRPLLALAWGLPLLLIPIAYRQGWLQAGWLYWMDQFDKVRGWKRGQQALLALLLLESVVLLAVALKAAPNTTDSLLYHMSRVAHWRQNQSLEHYAAVYHHQLWSPIFSEISILQLFILWGTDRLANLVQFTSMLGSVVAIAGVVKLLDGKRKTQLLAIAIAFSAPMALLQSTSTQTDYVVGFWSITTLYYLVRLVRVGLEPLDWVSLGAAVGLGMLSKVTYYPFLGLLLIAAIILAWRQGRQLKSLLACGLAAALLAACLNIGFWSRNIVTYGTPLGARDMLTSNTDLSLDPRAPVANGLQHLTLNYVTPWPALNEQLLNNANAAARLLGQSGDELEILWGWNHEDLAGNPVHITLLLLSIAVALLPWRKSRIQRWYAACLLLSFLGFAWAVEAGVHRVRYQVPWLLMAAPLAALVLRDLLGKRTLAWLSAGLLLLALPWILFNQTRPVVGWQPRTRTASVFTTSREVSLFANAPRARQPFSQAANAATAGGCQTVGLNIDAIDIEYAFWWLLQRQDPEVQVQIVNPLPELKQLHSKGFAPCAVICTNCQADQILGLDRQASFGPVEVFR